MNIPVVSTVLVLLSFDVIDTVVVPISLVVVICPTVVVPKTEESLNSVKLLIQFKAHSSQVMICRQSLHV